MKTRFLLIAGISLGLLFGLYLVGPKVPFEPLPEPQVEPWHISLDSLVRYVEQKEQGLQNLKPGNESRLIWADSLRQTEYSLVYLHGFSASPMESDSVPFHLARQFGMNLYMPLLAGHGLDSRESFAQLQPGDLVQSAKEAVAIGKLLGRKVVLMSCSTGSTLSVYLAGANPELIDALVMYSPNFALRDPTAVLITGPWGQQILGLVVGDYWNPGGMTDSPIAAQYWTTTYQSRGLVVLQYLLDQTMRPEVYNQVKQPYFIGYYFKTEEESDATISVPAILDFDRQSATPANRKRLQAFPEAGAHVIAHPLKSKSVEEVRQETARFLEEVLAIPGNY